MRFQKFECDSNCVGGRHRSATRKIYGDITPNSCDVLIGHVQFVIEKNL